ncbi:MAG TPA: toll/interleukin-1 receptor domain-containing protein [Candidatus Solibacter sp.]|nr:toll/interleukin-1 receptor domain-containing protein [Candidatus Solibacter sp.]
MAKSIDLFLSHNNADKPWTEGLAGAVEADGSGPPLKVFFDKWDIPPGGDIPAELEQGLQNSRYVGLVLSPESVASDWVTLERSTAIYRDPRARERSLIPLLRRDCNIPDMLARLRYIDFRRDADFNDGLDTLVGILRGRPAKRGGEQDASEVHFREDAALLKQHRKIFDRPAFKVPCIWELFIRELIQAIDDTVAAINTGSLFSRSGRLLSSFSDQNEYRRPEFKEAFSRITEKLIGLKRQATEFEEFFRRVNPRYSHHENFYAMVMSFHPTEDASAIKRLVGFMDSIDRLRNEILGELNVLLSKCGEEAFKEIELSSVILKKGEIGGADRIARFLE